MTSQQIRKLNVDLPRQPSVDERPWLIAGLLLAFAVLLMSAYAYRNNKKKGHSPADRKATIIVLINEPFK
jgi:hypothetical protein